MNMSTLFFRVKYDYVMDVAHTNKRLKIWSKPSIQCVFSIKISKNNDLNTNTSTLYVPMYDIYNIAS